MSYTKTSWVNGETPINATNLNKIEDQLEVVDDKLDADKVVNSASEETDEVYSADYLNEKLVSVGTTAPTDGERVWFAKSVNLLDLSNLTTQTTSGITITKNSDGSFAISGTSTANIALDIALPSPILLTSGITYTLSQGEAYSLGARYSLSLRASDKTIISGTNLDSGSSSLSITPSANIYVYYFRVFVVSGYTIEKTIYLQLEEGSTASDYEEYITPSIYVDEELLYQKPVVLWTNSSPTSSFATQSITLSDSISNYNYYEIIYKRVASGATAFSTGRVPTELRSKIEMFENGLNYVRTVSALSGTTMTFGDCTSYSTYGSTTTSTANSYMIPYQILGYQ